VADLPLLLLGPILRRAEPRHVSVFVATHQPAHVRVALFDGQVDAASPPPELAAKETHTTRFAAGFHAIVVTVDLTDAAAPLLPGHLYSYDVRVTPDGGTPQTLKDLELLKDTTLPGYGKPDFPEGQEVELDAIGYAENRLPSFVTCPAALDELVLAHASCRKPHGDGHPALQWLDGYVDDLHGAIAGRPHMLFLTGDQIYADDVAAALLPDLTALAIELLDGVEEVPSPVDNSKTLKVNTTVLPPAFRQRVTARSGFTSDWAASHLIGFGEFLAMYCAAWNPKLWPVLAVADTRDTDLSGPLRDDLEADAQNLRPDEEQTAPVVLGRPSPDAPDDVITPLYGGTQPEADALKKARREFLASKRLLDEYRREVSKVRRLLANVPTYMICDDHDVTDDWFMTGAIRGATTRNLFGRALVRNALAAHTICQAWGNEPQLWSDDDDHRILLEGISGMFPDGWDGGPADVDGAAAVVQTLGLTPTGEPLFDFSFGVEGPMHKVRVLDTRTRREYDSPKSPPGLLTVAALDHQLPLQELEQLQDDHPLIVISPAPVFGPPLLNEIGGPILVIKHDLFAIAWSESERALDEQATGLPYGTPLGMQYYDIEHWGAHPGAFERLLERLSRHPRVIVLGGDVHYGGAYAMDWTGDGRTSRIVHFTSSAAKNDWKDSAAELGPPGIVHNLFSLNGLATGLQNIGFPMTRLGWSATLPPVVTGLEKEPPSTRLRVQSGPVVLSNEHFRARHPLTRPPDWVWRAAPIVDVRPPDERPPAARVTEPAADLPQDGGAVRQYGAVAAMHVQALRTAAVARGLQFLNNVGLITFVTSADGIHVSQALYSLRAREDPNEKGDAYVVYDTLLELAPAPTPTAVGPEG
jgi:hypothetical protein